MRLLKIIFIYILFFGASAHAQSVLNNRISLNIQKQKLGEILGLMEQKGSFRFSYNSNILPVDSLVSIKESDLSMEDVLDQLLNNRFEYRQAGKFVIVRYAPLELMIRINESIGSPDLYTITGQIVDKRTEKPIQNASIYERSLLVSEISDENGLFTMKLKNITKPITLMVNKENYKSAVTHFLAEVVISSKKDTIAERFLSGNLDTLEKTWLGKALITTKQKIQSINIGGFISNAPVQFSLLPSLNSHGSMSGQVVNKFSFNAVGAYSAGVDGGEVGLIFNINKSNVQYFQFGGAFNLVGGDVRGTQIAGFFNYDLGKFKGAQVTLGYNRIGKNFEGFQIGGLHNRVVQDFKGMQISLGLNSIGGNFRGFQAGMVNYLPKEADGFQAGVLGNFVAAKSRGVQVAGVANLNKEADGVNIAVAVNLTSGVTRGVQIGTLNYTKHLKGLQIGVVNVSDENDGYSIGLLNISWKGYHKFSFTTNETTQLNFAYKGGSKKFYNILMAGMNARSSAQVYTGGLGFGTDIALHRKFSLNPEISSQYVYQGSLEHFNLLNKFELSMNFKINKWLAIQGGPSVNVLYSDQRQQVDKFVFLQEKRKLFTFDNSNFTGWLGWSFGIVLL
jgi:hypothetical protein